MQRGSKVFFLAAAAVAVAALAIGYARRSAAPWWGGGAVALLRVEGPIFDVDWYLEQVREFASDDRVKAVVVRVDSPGGGIAPTQELHRELSRLGERKPVVASMGTVAASGGYYLCCAADWVVANPGTITGSIGVIMELTNVEGLLGKLGLRSRAIKSGAHKDMGSPFREITEEEERLLQELIDDSHDQFVEAVLEARPVERESVLPYFDGRVLTGRQAHELGLVDELGDLQDAVAKASELAGLPEPPEELLEPQRPHRGLISILFGTEAASRLEAAILSLAEAAEGGVSLQLWRAF